MSWFLIHFFLKSKTRKHSEKQKNKQGEILISPFIGSLLFYFIQFGQLKKKPKNLKDQFLIFLDPSHIDFLLSRTNKNQFFLVFNINY